MDYQRVYNLIINKARKENRQKKQGVYYEAHHINPLCLGGDGKKSEWRYHPNVVLLTAKEHFICHRLLTKIYPTNKKLIYAFWAMCVKKDRRQVRYIPSGRAFEEAKQNFLSIVRGREGTFKGRKHSEEAKQNQSRAQKGRVRSKEHCENLSNALKGHIPWNKGKITGPVTEEIKLKMRLAKLGKHKKLEL